MKSLFIVLLNFYIFCNDFISNENICEIIKTNGSFTGVKTLNKWFVWNFSREGRNYMYSNGKEWEYKIILKKNENKSYEISFDGNTVEDIDRNVINRFGVHIKHILLDHYYNCDISYKVIIN